MPRFPQYTSFKPGELEATLNAIKAGTSNPPDPAPNAEPASDCPARIIKSSSTGIILEAECPITFPDRVEGTARYERRGPKEHLISYFHTSRPLAEIWCHDQVPKGPPADRLQFIAQKAQECVGTAYDVAIDRERKGYFMRATESESGNRRRRKDAALPGITVEMAKILSGKYAVCNYSQGRLQPRGNPLLDNYETLKEANDAFNARADPSLRVCCFNRLDRCWQCPRFNPLYYWLGTDLWEKR